MLAHDSGLLRSHAVNESLDYCTTRYHYPAWLKTEGLT